MVEALRPAFPGNLTRFRLDGVGPLAVAFVLCAVEVQRHWNQPVMWAYLVSGSLVAFTWTALLAGRPWATHGRQSVDAAIVVLVAYTVVFQLLGNGTASRTLSNSLMFWAPLICLWWGLSLPNHRRLALFYFVMLYGTPLYTATYASGIVFFEQTILGALTLVVARQFALDRSMHQRMLRDRLTGLISAECFETELAMIAAMADRYRVSFSLIGCAPDRQTEVHQDPDVAASDALLQSMANMIVERIRQSDTVCRWEDDIFFVLLPNTSNQDASRVAQTLLVDCPAHSRQAVPPLTCSLGIATHRFGDDPMLTFGAAEQALRTSRQRGGNRVTLAS
jgi:diguanylate cyclase (GGDEF)-like protein